MLRSTALLTAVTLAAVVGAAGCGNSDDTGSAPPTATASQAASKTPADKLDGADAAVLRGVGETVAQYCSGHKA
ncbi:MAG TPA: hypothetical protein VGI54_11590, partial [Solirubrobacteraceae bacterium]